MTETLKRLLATAAVVATLPFALFGPSTATAAQTKLAMGDCDGEWQLSAPSGSPPTQTLTCAASGVPTIPSCSIGGAATGTPGGPGVLLTANCTQGPGSWLWSGGSCEGNPNQTCTAAPGSEGSVTTYGVVATNAQGSSNNATKAVTWTSAPAPSGCTLLLSASSVSVNTFVDLTAQCTTVAAASWTWSTTLELLDGTSTTSGSNQITPTQAGTYTITATPKNSNGVAGSAVSRTLTVTTTSGGSSGGGTGTTGATIASCTGFSKTKIMDIAFGPDGSVMGRKYVTDAGVFRNGASAGFGATEALIVVFTAPEPDIDYVLGVTHTGGTYGGSSTRTFVLSTTPCNFALTGPDTVWSNQAPSMSLRFSTGTPTSGRYDLIPGKEYYLNIKNKAFNDTAGCTVSRCDVLVTYANP